MSSDSPVRTRFGVGNDGPGTYNFLDGTKFEVRWNLTSVFQKKRKLLAASERWRQLAEGVLTHERGNLRNQALADFLCCKQVHGQNWKRFTKGVLWQQFTSVYDKTLEHSDNLYVVVGGLRWLPFERGEAFKKLWDNFRKTHTAMSLAAKWKTCVLVSDRKISKQMHEQCNIQTPLQDTVLQKIYDSQSKLTPDTWEKAEAEKYLLHMTNELAVLCDDEKMSTAAIMYTSLLFERLQKTFRVGGDAEMQKWVFELPGIQIGNNLHKLSFPSHKIAKCYGVLPIMFGICAYLAFGQQQDEFWEEKGQLMANIIFWHEDADKTPSQKDRNYDCFLLRKAILIRLDWKVHVSVEDYVAGVKALEGLAQADKDAILQMFADDEKALAAELDREACPIAVEALLRGNAKLHKC